MSLRQSSFSNTALSYNNLSVFHFNIMLTIDILVTKRSAVILHLCAWATVTERHSLFFFLNFKIFNSYMRSQT